MTTTETQKVHNYPLTAGKKLALEYFYWRSLEASTAEICAPSLLRLAMLIDDKINPACALLKKAPA